MNDIVGWGLFFALGRYLLVLNSRFVDFNILPLDVDCFVYEIEAVSNEISYKVPGWIFQIQTNRA